MNWMDRATRDLLLEEGRYRTAMVLRSLGGAFARAVNGLSGRIAGCGCTADEARHCAICQARAQYELKGMSEEARKPCDCHALIALYDREDHEREAARAAARLP